MNKKERKDVFGEVLTPIELVDEILNQLPKNVWSNPNLKFLDPCAGEGVFLTLVKERLEVGLEKEIPNTTERKNHIETMLTMVELNPSNVITLNNIFKNANIHQNDFLTMDFKNESFNIILGNPPYQTAKKGTYTGSAGNITLWDKFVIHSLEILSKNGYMGFITPSNWRRPEHKLYRTITDRLLYLHIYGKPAGIEKFGVQTRFDVYVLGDIQTKNPVIIDEKGEYHTDINPREWNFLPNYEYKTIQQILSKDKESGINVIYHSSRYDARKLTKNKTEKYRYPVIHSLTKKGIGLRYANKQDTSMFGVSKIILNVNEKQYPINDSTGKYGMSQLSFGIPIKNEEEGENMIRCIEGESFQEIIKATKWGSFQTDYRMFHYLRPDFYNIISSSKNTT
jgi:hypothetical protein